MRWYKTRNEQEWFTSNNPRTAMYGFYFNDKEKEWRWFRYESNQHGHYPVWEAGTCPEDCKTQIQAHYDGTIGSKCVEIKEAFCVWHEDAGHGWLKVPKPWIEYFGFEPTQFSYKDEDFFYLEEDLDAQNLIKKLVEHGPWQNSLVPTKYDGDSSPIRDLQRC